MTKAVQFHKYTGHDTLSTITTQYSRSNISVYVGIIYLATKEATVAELSKEEGHKEGSHHEHKGE